MFLALICRRFLGASYAHYSRALTLATLSCNTILAYEGQADRRTALLYSVNQKNPHLGDLTFFIFFHKRLRICNRFYTHLLDVPIFIQLSPILTKLCHIKRRLPSSHNMRKMSKRAKTRAFRRLRKSLMIALLIVVCGKSL